MKEIGDILRRCREGKKLTQEYVNAQTHIPLKYVSAMEEGDLSVFPAELYYLGSVRRYSRFLGLNDEDLIALYRRHVAETTISKTPSQKENNIPLSRTFYTVLIIGVVILFAGLLLWVKHELNLSFPAAKEKIVVFLSGGVSVVSRTAATTVSAVPKLIPEKKPAVKEINNLILEVSCSENSWLKVESDDKLVYEGVLKAGDAKTWESSEKIYISIGYVPGLKVTLNGIPVDIRKGAKNDVNSLTLTKDYLKKTGGEESL